MPKGTPGADSSAPVNTQLAAKTSYSYQRSSSRPARCFCGRYFTSG